jgi:hypothetical protein
MRKIFLILGSFLTGILFLGLFLAGTVWAKEMGQNGRPCPDCQPVVHISEEGTAVPRGGGPSIGLTKTVDTDPGACATSDTYTLPPGGGVVYYCYYVRNTGDVSFSLHTVVDDQIGILLGPDFPFSLIPGGTAWFTFGINITETVLNAATWQAYNAGPTDLVTGTDTALVVVESPITALTATNSSPTPLGQPTTLATDIEGGGNETYTWNFGDGLTGTGAITTHIYPAIGVYTAVVTATNSYNSLTATTVITIQHMTYMQAVFQP